MNRMIEVSCHLIISPSTHRVCGEDRVKNVSVSIRSKRPSLGPLDQALQLRLRVPESLFFKPQLTASIEVPEGDAPPVITPDIASDIAEVVRERTGIRLSIEAPADTEEAHNG